MRLFFINKEHLLFFYGVILQFLFIYFSGNIVLLAFSTIFLLAPVIFLSQKNIFILVIFLIPAQRFFVLEDGGITLINLYFLYLLAYYFIFSDIKVPKVFLFLIYMLFVIVVVGALYRGDINEVLIFFKFCLVIFVVCFIVEKNDFYFYNKVVWSFILGTFFMLLLSFMLGSSSGKIRFSGGDVNDANYTALVSALSIAVLLVLYSIKRIKVITFASLLMFFLFFGLMTQSRAFLSIIFIISIFYILRNFRFAFLKSIFVFIPVFLLGSYYILNSYQDIPLLNNVVQRILEPSKGDLSNGRLDLWGQYISILFTDNNIFFGLGSNAYKDYNIGHVAHSFLIEDLVSFGLLGTAVFYFIFIYFFIRYVGKLRGQFYGLLPIVVFLVGSITLHSFLGMGGIISIVVCILSMSLYKNRYFVLDS